MRRDLKCQNLLSEVSNATVIGKIQSKLPIEIEKKWSQVEYDVSLLEKSSTDRFTRLMKFLTKYKEIVENRSPDVKAGSGKTFTIFVTGMTVTTKDKLGGGRYRKDYAKSSSRIRNIRPCLACDDGATNKESIIHMLAECDV